MKKTSKSDRLATGLAASRQGAAIEFKRTRADMLKYYLAEREQRRIIAKKHARILAKMLAILEKARNGKLISRKLLSKQIGAMTN